MPVFFICSLATVLVAAYIFDKSADEMAYLAASISIVGLLVSLVIAPWQIQLLLLVLVLFATRRLSLSAQRLVEPPSAKKTQLTYRGSNYEFKSSTTEATETEVIGKYRGQIWKTRSQEQPPVQPLSFQVKYRGASAIAAKPLTPSAK